MNKASSRPRYALVIHGGAGTMSRNDMTPELETDFNRALAAALEAGERALAGGGSALDAVEAAIVSMEDSPLFNAGHGAVFHEGGGHELDASIMEGANLKAGAIAGARHTRNPIRVARAIMERTEHLLMVGEGADAVAESLGFSPVPQSYFATDWRRRMLDKIKTMMADGSYATASDAQKHGTVGAAALDAAGNLAAGTSTGGYTNKPLGRVGDSPVIGAGTYADNRTCAISATGKGEFFVRKVLAHEIHCRMLYQGKSLAAAADELIHKELPEWKSGAGLVALDRHGTVVMPFNTEGMYRGSVVAGGRIDVAIY
jgi:beta-aspartyl-peptidase (threonine type)